MTKKNLFSFLICIGLICVVLLSIDIWIKAGILAANNQLIQPHNEQVVRHNRAGKIMLWDSLQDAVPVTIVGEVDSIFNFRTFEVEFCEGVRFVGFLRNGEQVEPEEQVHIKSLGFYQYNGVVSAVPFIEKLE